MIPALNADGNLPPGSHPATWDELADRFGSTPHRRRLLAGLYAAARSLRDAGCRTLYIDGSFVTAKPVPEDFDGCWEPSGVNPDALDPILLTFEDGRAAQKAKYLGELFPADVVEVHSGSTFLGFFQIDRETGRRKGIIALDLEALP